MARDKSKIFANDVHVFLIDAASGWSSPPDKTTDSGNIEIGWCEGGQTKLSSANRAEIDLNNNTKFHLSSQYKLELMALQSDATNLAALESFEDGVVDILLVKTADLTGGWQIKGCSMVVEPDMTFDAKTPLKIKVEFTVSAKRLSDVFSEESALVNFS